MNRHVRGMDLSNQQILHLEEIAPDDWRGVDFQRSAGLCIYRWESAITRIADLIGSLYRLDISEPPASVMIDRAGNIWLDHEYLSPHRYLPLLIPKSLP